MMWDNNINIEIEDVREIKYARISKCVPTHIFLRKNLNYRNHVKLLIHWKPRHCSIWI